MDSLNRKHEQLLQALKTLHEALTIFELIKQTGVSCGAIASKDATYRMSRDSMIQRFEYSIDSFWKYLKKYLEMQDIPGINIPRDIIRETYSLGLITQEEAENILEMFKDRNMTSHTYIDAIAQKIAAKIPSYYQTMQAVILRLIPQ